MVAIKRKVIQIANSTQLISLPRKWTLKYGVKKGDELEITENGTSLKVSTEKTPHFEEITVDVSGLTPRLADRFLARAYQKGYDKITIKFDKPELMIAIQNKVPELLGFEIMEQNNKSCVIQTISSKLEVDFDSLLRKAFIITLDMADSCLEALENNDKKTLENLHFKDFDVNKFCYFCLRFINKGQHEGFGNYIVYYLIELLEDVGDEYKALAQLLIKTESKKEIIKILGNTNRAFKMGYEFFYKPEKSKATEAMELYNKTKADIENSFGKLKNSNDLKALATMNYILKLVYHYPTMRLDTLKELSGV
ncbi:phosphate uptake regulator PhoU [Candidatus Woesearchaeota archaeon]|nr:phosphate uptake regulator PhoU [Candidatus Woesearchaeota archaeon]